ncbi:unnamed protein product, partial [marine sediment metagenome]
GLNSPLSKFCISPPGGGIDCHRIWEAICLDTIPIVLKNIAFKQFRHLPILFIDSWEQISNEFLEKKYEEFSQKTFNTDLCYMDYWKSSLLNK